MLVSVIIPAYNAAPFIEETVRSVLAQTIAEWECIIVNDGATDNTESILKKLVLLDERIRYVNKPNGGLSSARNRGLQEATGTYIQFLDADDTIAPNKFESHLQAIRSHQYSLPLLTYCDYRLGKAHDIYEEELGYRNPRFNGKDYFKELLLRWEIDLTIPCHCFLWPAVVFQQPRMVTFDESLPNHEDIDCWLRIFQSQPIAVEYINQVLCWYRTSSQSMSANQQRMKIGYLMVLDKLAANGSDPIVQSWIATKKENLLVYFKDFQALSVGQKIKHWQPILKYYTKRLFELLKLAKK